MSEKHTYPDGSAVVGAPPWPKLSPLERARGEPEPVEAPPVDVDTPEPAAKKPAAKKQKDA